MTANSTKIADEATYKRTLKRISELMAECDELIKLVVAYEDEHYPIGKPREERE